MRMKKIGIIVGASALAVSAVTLTSCGSDSFAIELKSYKTESTEDVIEKAYNNFITEKKITSYDLTVYENKDSNIKQDKAESKTTSSIARVETYNAITSVLYTLDDRNIQAESAYGKTNQAMRVEKIYQNDNGLNTIINLTDKTYTSLAYNASAAKTRTSSFKAEILQDNSLLIPGSDYINAALDEELIIKDLFPDKKTKIYFENSKNERNELPTQNIILYYLLHLYLYF